MFDAIRDDMHHTERHCWRTVENFVEMKSPFEILSSTTKELLTISEVATILRGSKAHAQNLLTGKVKGAHPLQFVPVGRRKLVRRETLLWWIQRSEAESQVVTSSTCQNSASTAQESES
jgi:hypothetical protein